MPRNYKRAKPALSKRQYRAVAQVANKQIHKMSELKVYNGLSSSVVSRWPATLTKINPPAQGDGQSDRDGDSIYIKSLAVNGMLSPETANHSTHRVMLIQWLEDDSTAPVLSDILTDVASSELAINSFYITNPQKQFKVLDDRLYFFDTNNSSALKPYRVRVKSRDIIKHKPDYNPAALTGTGNFYLITMSNSTTDGSMRTPLSRLRYFDN